MLGLLHGKREGCELTKLECSRCRASLEVDYGVVHHSEAGGEITSEDVLAMVRGGAPVLTAGELFSFLREGVPDGWECLLSESPSQFDTLRRLQDCACMLQDMEERALLALPSRTTHLFCYDNAFTPSHTNQGRQ